LILLNLFNKHIVMRDFIKVTAEIKFEKVKFVSKSLNRGRCTKCAATEMCGSKFACPCKEDEQLVIVEMIAKRKD